MSDFDRAIEFVLASEGYGGKAVPGDPGALTIWGVAAKWHPEEVAAMAKMTPDAAKEIAKGIYLKEYWQAAHCDTLPWPANLVVFDYAVQSAPTEAWGAWHRQGSWRGILCYRVQKYLMLAEHMPQFLNGWLNRMEDLYLLASEG